MFCCHDGCIILIRNNGELSSLIIYHMPRRIAMPDEMISMQLVLLLSYNCVTSASHMASEHFYWSAYPLYPNGHTCTCQYVHVWPLVKSAESKKCSYFSTETYVVGTKTNRLYETVFFVYPSFENLMHMFHVHVKWMGKKVFTILHSLKILFI